MKYFLLIPTLVLIASCSFFPDVSPKNPVETDSGSIETGSIEKAVLVQTGQSSEDRLKESKRRINFRSIVRKGDYFSLKNDQDMALRYYLNAYIRLKDDHVLERKIAGVYFDLKDYRNAYDYYTRVPFVDLPDTEKEQMLQAIMFDDTIPIKSSAIAKLGLSADEMDYYGYMENCYTGIHNCVVSLQAYSGSYEPTKKLKDILDSYTKISSDFQYRNILLAGAFFEAKQYLAGAKIATEITMKRPDYRMAYKIAGYCYYELGMYREANTYLGKYYAFDPTDVKIAYTLGLTNYYLEDYVTSNLYFNTAVKNGYTPKTELERRLLYNYFVLNDTKGMFKIFRYLLIENDVNENDFIIAVHIAMQDNNISKAFLLVNKGIIKFPGSDMLLAQRSSLSLSGGNLERAQEDLEKAYAMSQSNPLTLLNFAKLQFAKNDYTSAEEYAKNTVEIDSTDGMFGEEAEALLSTIEKVTLANTDSGSTDSGSIVDTGGVVTDSGNIME